MIRRIAVASATLWVTACPLVTYAAPASCESLAKLSFPQVTITTAQEVTSGEFSSPDAGRGPGGGRLTNLPAFCRVALTVAPQIHVEVWLPRDTWNRSYRGEGGGGYAGTIS